MSNKTAIPDLTKIPIYGNNSQDARDSAVVCKACNDKGYEYEIANYIYTCDKCMRGKMMLRVCKMLDIDVSTGLSGKQAKVLHEYYKNLKTPNQLL